MKVATRVLKWRNKPIKILVIPNKKLKRIAKPIDFSKESKESLVAVFIKMSSALNATTWGEKLGLAAPQIGINKRMMIVWGVPVINPKWTPTKAPLEMVYEGCYSLPKGDVYKVSRAKYGWATFYTVEGEHKNFKIKGTQSIVFQHELDHLDGKCCNEIGEKVEQDNKLKK